MAYHYCIRPSVKSLYRQYYGYCKARLKVLRKFPGFFRLKHIIPSAAILSVALSPLWLLLPFPWAILAGAAPGLYFCFIISGSIYLASRNRFPALYRIAASMVALHCGYGLGLLSGFVSRQRFGSPKPGSGRHAS
jgi:hypothetical protein